MKSSLTFLIVVVLSAISFAQNPNEVRASMGIDFVSVPKLKNYLEVINQERLSDFSSAINFSGSYGRMMGPNSQLEIELGYLLNSHNFNLTGGTYDLTYSLIMPSVLYNYVLTGTGYNFKFGCGAGVRVLSITEKLPGDPNNYDYSKIGYGFILRAVGNTSIAENVFAHIGADIRYDVISETSPTIEGNTIGDVNFNSLSVGIRLGISYQF